MEWKTDPRRLRNIEVMTPSHSLAKQNQTDIHITNLLLILGQRSKVEMTGN